MRAKKAQTLVEFALLALLIIGITLGALSLFGNSLGTLFEQNSAANMTSHNISNEAARTAFGPDN